MRTRLFTLLAFLFMSTLTVQAQKSKISSPIELNDYYVSVTDSLYTLGQKWGEQFNTSYKSKDFSTLSKHSKLMLQYIERKQKEIMVQKDFGGSENLRLAILDFLSYEKRLISEAFVPFEKFNTSATEEQIDAALQKLTDIAKMEAQELIKVQEAQEAFAAKNGFTIEE